MSTATLPPSLLAHTGAILDLERPPQGGYYDVSILTAERGRFVLKVGATAALQQELQDEVRVLDALRPWAPFVPIPVAHAEGFFLFTCVEGVQFLDALEATDEAGRHRLMAGLGHALRRLHTWTPALPRPTAWVTDTLAQAARRVEAGEVSNPIRSWGQFGGSDPREVLAEISASLPPLGLDLVFTHGDFCLPNAIASEGRITGIIDWSRGAYADRRWDLATAVKSTRHNLKDEAYVCTFLEAYGYTEPAASLRPFEGLEQLT